MNVLQILRPCLGPDSMTGFQIDNLDGTYDVSYTITATGNYSVRSTTHSFPLLPIPLPVALHQPAFSSSSPDLSC